jgi:flagellar hook-associated protein 2
MTKDNHKTAVSDFVKAYNSLTSEAKNQTAKGANLQGESAVTSVASKLRGTTWMNGSVGSVSSLKDLGITVSKEGVMSFDEATFNTKFDAAESDVKTVLAELGSKVDDVSGSDSSTGKFIQQRQEGYTAKQKRVEDRIERINDKLSQKETQYYNTFIALQKSMNSTSTNYSLSALSAYTNNNS